MASLAPPDCASRFPQVLNVGLPFAGDVEIDIDDVQGRLQRSAERLYGPLALCPGRPLQVNGVIGTDYQILDWLSRELIDVAVVPALSLHLLERDGADLLELPDLPDMSRGWLASTAAQLESVDVGPGGGRHVRSAAEAERDFGALRALLLERARRPGEEARLPTRFVFTSHLSTTGFLVPVAEMHRWLEAELAPLADEDERHAVRAAFWDEVFQHACFDFGARVETGRSCPEVGAEVGAGAAVGATAGAGRGALREIRFVSRPAELADPAGAPAAPPVYAFGEPVRDRLVILRSRAGSIFEASPFVPARAELPAELAPLVGERRPVPGEARPPVPAFKSHLQREPYYGTRTFAFSVDESLRLLELHQRLATTGGLALVLPGGGVKAAYQSRLIDKLYQTRLVNGGGGGAGAATVSGGAASGRAAATAPGRLRVSHVIGTSGGALLGFFVARLGPDGPHDLSQILWFRPPPGHSGREHEQPLDSADVFGWTDLPRYASLLTIFLVFSAGLTLASLGWSDWLTPAQPAGAAGPRGIRLGLLVPLALVVGATPVLVAVIGRRLGLDVEHVPEFEGLLYAVLLVVAMFADQCLVPAGERTAGGPRPSARVGVWLIALGVAMMVVPATAGRFAALRPALGWKVSFGAAYLALGAASLVLLLATARRRRGPGARSAWVAVAGFAAGTLAAFAVLAWAARAAPGLLERLDRVPLLFLALGATVMIVLVGRAARGAKSAPGWVGRLQRHGGTLAGSPAARTTTRFLAPFLTCLLIVDLTRPEADRLSTLPLRDLLDDPSKLDLPLGALAVCVGALVVLLGLLVRLQGKTWGYKLENETEFVDAALLVIVGLALAVYFTLWVASRVAPGSFTLFELTWDFWKALLIVSAVFSAALLVWAHLKRWRAPESLRAGLAFLTSRHPNGQLVSRRFVRMLLVGAGGFLWWNLLLAPGLYGNRYAHDYLDSTAVRFDQALGPARSMGLTAPLLATANALKTDGTRYFLVVPGSEPCPVIREPAGSGSVWRRFHAIADGHHASGEGSGAAEDDECLDLDLGDAGDREVMRRFVFASGSPFPIFPAHWVRASRDPDAEREALVDGGYSNNTPVEAAWRLGTERVLIVNSSHPLKADCGGGGGLTSWVGPLASNAVRLPGFLFERSQQLDRRSRANLFVVSLSPRPLCDWPGLSDFRRSVVERMIDEADRDLDRRIGLVESWGPPRFQVSAQVGGQRVGDRAEGAPGA